MDPYADADAWEPYAVYCDRQATALARRLQADPPTDPALRARLERDVEEWRRQAAAATIDEHWRAGEGDRRLF